MSGVNAMTRRLADLPRMREFERRSRDGMLSLGGLGQFDFADAFAGSGDALDFSSGGMDFSATDFTATGASPWSGVQDFGSQAALDANAIPAVSMQTFTPPDVSGASGSVTSEGVGSNWFGGGGLSMPSWDTVLKTVQAGASAYSQATQAEAQKIAAQKGLPKTPQPAYYGAVTTNRMPASGQVKQAMIWNPQTGKYEPAKTGAVIAGVNNMVVFGVLGLGALFLLKKVL